MARIFISSEASDDPRVTTLIAGLGAHQLDRSPLNPRIGDDPKWQDWYARGLASAIANADAFVAVVTAGYDSSSWMAQELHEALIHFRAHARPLLFIAKPTPTPLPRGFLHFEQASTLLIGSAEDAAASLRDQLAFSAR